MQRAQENKKPSTGGKDYSTTGDGKACYRKKEGVELVKLLTPTQLIRQAALKTGTVVTPTPWKPRKPGKKIRKSEMNQVQVGDHVGVVMSDPEMQDVSDEACWLCGGETGGQGLPVKKAILDTFTDHDMARQPASQSVCSGCAFCLSFLSLRNYSILATQGELRHPTRAELRDILLNPPEPPFVLCIATSGQKWLHFKGEVSYSRNGYPVQLEETRVYVDTSQLEHVLVLVENLYTVFSKKEILSGEYSQNRIKKFGLARFQRIEKQAATYRGQRLFELGVFVAQKREEK